MAELADVVIVGGGIIGAALAYELARRSQRVTLLDSHALASGASSGSFAWINATSKDEDESYHRLNAQGVARYDALATEWGAEQIGLHEGGSLFWTRGSDTVGREQLRARAARLQGWGYPVALLNASEIRALEPHLPAEGNALEGAEGLFAPTDRWLDTPRFVRFLTELARKRGADIQTYTPATEFMLGITRSVVQVKTPSANIGTPLLILAAGIQTPRLAAGIIGNQAEKVVPLRSAPGVLVETSPDSMAGVVHRVLYPPDTGGLHLRPTPGGGLLLGSEDMDTALTAENASEVVQSAASALLARAGAVFPDLSADALLSKASARLCLRPMPADDRPIVGALPEVRGVFVAVTHSGITLGPLLAQLLADQLLSGRVPPQLTPYSPMRFLRPLLRS